MSLDRTDTTPLHVQLAQELRAAIRDHRLPPGSALGSEAVLQERYGVARSVVRQALASLVSEGLLERGRGRGSTVAPAREHHRLVQRSSGLFTQMAREGVAVTTEVLGLVEEAASGDATWLGSDRVLRLERLRRVEDRPLARILTFLPLPACAGLSAASLQDASLHDVLASELGRRAVGGPRQVRAVAADVELGRDLDTPAGGPLLLLEGRSTDQHGRPLEVFATWHRATDVAFDVEVDRGPAPRGAEGGAVRADLTALAAQAHQIARTLETLAEQDGPR